MKKLEKILSINTLARRVIILLMILIWGWIDIATGYEYSFAVFYLIPVSIAAWFDNKRVTIFTIIAAGITWLYADFVSGHHYSNIIIPYWNAVVRLGFFSVVAFLVMKVRENLAAMTLMAMKDSLTLLNNARAFGVQYHELRLYKNKSGYKIAIALIDLDGFKAVNDQYGHSKGDDILVEFAEILKAVARPDDVIARLGGDEFVMILKDIHQQSAEIFEQKLRTAFLASTLKQRYGVDFSMGIRIFEQLPENLDVATHQADQLMYQSKAQGKSQTVICMA
ncbi:GGDEF domain-containing protein [Acinetobacter sichuanensis]|uniref:GGDEF domain-containing protein n=1 Tax=Acinetobacter sichuanensis TaxID=2136183 RepID=UPI00280C4283|nr:GGDEF domain-containing protein [Acinetobacter sichuanensis]MDQ9020860.1 GGDEF domain-containing protein [Acinetobacter sichuanensis]